MHHLNKLHFAQKEEAIISSYLRRVTINLFQFQIKEEKKDFILDLLSMIPNVFHKLYIYLITDETH